MSANLSASERQTVKLLCKSILNRLENQKSITFSPRLRQIIQDELYSLVGPYIFTEQDLREKALARMGAKAEIVAEIGAAESDQYKAAKAVIRQSFGDDELNGFFFQKPLKTVAETIAQYLMRSSHIDDVFEEDREIERQIVDTVQRFNPADLH